MMAIVAGTAPLSRIICSTVLAISTFCGYGIPCEMIVDSNATTGRLLSNACCTSLLIDNNGFMINLFPLIVDILFQMT